MSILQANEITIRIIDKTIIHGLSLSVPEGKETCRKGKRNGFFLMRMGNKFGGDFYLFSWRFVYYVLVATD